MVSSANDRIMRDYLVKYGAIRMSERPHPIGLLETLYMTERYRAGDDLKAARERYDIAIWNGVKSGEIARRLTELDHFMTLFARERMKMWGLLH